VVTQLASWIELSRIGRCDHSIKTQLNSTKKFPVSREVLSMFRTSRLTADWGLFVQLSWVALGDAIAALVCMYINSMNEFIYLFIYLLYMKPMHNELKTLTNVTKYDYDFTFMPSLIPDDEINNHCFLYLLE